MHENLPLSRPLATAQRLGDLAPDRHRFHDKPVLLTGEPDVLSTANGIECFLDSLRLLVRVTSHLTVSPPIAFESLRNDCQQLAETIEFGSGTVVIDSAPDFSQYAAILSVGSRARRDLPWTVINSNGWLARVSSGMVDLARDCTQTNPVSSLAAASLGVAEVFKRLIRLKESRGRLLDGTTFSLESYRCGDDTPGTPLPEELHADLLLVGAGAIGNGIAHLLARLPIDGRAWVVDAQRYQPENLGTCLLIGPSDIDTPKAEFAAQVLDGRLKASGFHEEIAEFRRRLGREIPYPVIILNGLDNPEARREIQYTWPDMIIDGAIGDFPCQVSRHSWSDDSACLACLFRQAGGEAAEQVQSRATGLSISRVRQFDALVTDEDVRGAPLERQDWLRAHVGQQICSVVREGVAQEVSDEQHLPGFEPSVPFVACMSASMVVAEAVRFLAGWQTALDTRFQFDLLRGPERGEMFPQERRQDCDCVTRAANIEKWRNARMAASTNPAK